jgi:hypothetical protein
MKPKKVNEIMSKVMKEWIRRYGVDKIDPRKLKATRDMLLLSPHEDGFMRVQLIEGSGEVYLVPFEDIILNGLKGKDVVEKYQIENENRTC